MFKKLKSGLVLLLATAFVASMAEPAAAGLSAAESGENPAISTGDPFTEKLHAMCDEPEEEYWPWARWWLDEGHHTDSTLAEDA